MNHRYDPHHHAQSIGLRIAVADLTGMYGYIHQGARTIVLDRHLTWAEQRCTVAHEIVHFERGDTDTCPTPWHASKQERSVHLIAARRLLWLEDLHHAAVLSPHRHDQADHLGVDLPTLRARIQALTPHELAVLDAMPSPVYRRRTA